MTIRTLPPCITVSLLDRLMPAIHRPLRYSRAAIVAVNYDSEGRPIEDLLTRTVGLFKVVMTADTIRASWTWDDGQDRVEMALYRISELYCTREPEEDFDRMVLVGSAVDMEGAPEMGWSIPIQDTPRRMTIVTSATKPRQATLEAWE